MQAAPVQGAAMQAAPMQAAPRRGARDAAHAYMPLFAAFAASGVLSAATEGDTALTRERAPSSEAATVSPPPAARVPPERPVPIRPTVETPPRRRSTPAVRARAVKPPRGLALIGHWLRQVRLRHLGLAIIGLVALALT
jgi:hypothetical protein